MELKNLLNKKTIVSTSVGTLMAIAAGTYTLSGSVQEVLAAVRNNSAEIESLHIQIIRRDVAVLKAELRTLNREFRADPKNEYVIEDIEEVQDEIQSAELILDCLIDPEAEVCE